MGVPRIRQVRAYTVRGGGGDYHDQASGHWIDDHIATPMARYPQYRGSRQSFGINVLGTLVVQVEADDGAVGFGVTVGGEIGAWIVERHLARLLEGQPVTDVEKLWDQMYRATIHYGRKGVVLNAISGVDLALWDLLGQIRQEPVYAMLGGAVRDELVCYATGPRPDLAQKMGFIGGKLPLKHGPPRARRGCAPTWPPSPKCASGSVRTSGSCGTAGCRSTWTTPPASPTPPTGWACAGSRNHCCPTTTGATASCAAGCRRGCC
ncbi:hypothetical protein Prum_004440 [Phytohabitans rumicis]|uniref:Mandelate racemase/muconate lactonizing enzyme N-terminal domain-containing protein n=1 Tax=Phytohabitans rumicis TaxID=1076125 RepID=A0A6V8KNR8_9ACTN|nr:hypothetical protein Prum_004440 [Phytohabitans rumicis]